MVTLHLPQTITITPRHLLILPSVITLLYLCKIAWTKRGDILDEGLDMLAEAYEWIKESRLARVCLLAIISMLSLCFWPSK